MDPERFKINQPQSKPVPDRQADPLAPLPPSPPHQYPQSGKTGHRYWWLWLVGVVIVLALAGAGYLALKSKTHTKPKPTVAVKHTTVKKATTPAPTIATSSFTSPSFGVTFNYPKTWNVVDSGSAGVSINSTPMTITNADDQPVLGEISVTILPKGTLPSAFGTSTSVAVLNSQKIVFTHPGNSQPAATYLSFVQYSSTTTVGGLDGVYITGNYGYQKDQIIPAAQVSQVDPLIMATVNSCANSSCSISTQKRITINASDWNNTNFSTPILLIFKSLSFS